MTSNLLAFLRARFAEDRALASAALSLAPSGWSAHPSRESTDDTDRVVSGVDREIALYMHRLEPRRYLAEIDAKARTLVRCEEELLAGIPRLTHFVKQTVREMALPYSDHPDYQAAVASFD
jgi:hypothetical protein